MDDLTAIRDFRSARDAEPPEARDRVRLALEARMDAAAAEARSFGEAVADSRPPATAPARRRGFFVRRRRVLAFAGAVAAAAIVAGALVLNSGPTAQRASAAEILHEAAGAAASDSRDGLDARPGAVLPSRKERQLNVMGWVSPVPWLKAGIPTPRPAGTMKYPTPTTRSSRPESNRGSATTAAGATAKPSANSSSGAGPKKPAGRRPGRRCPRR